MVYLLTNKLLDGKMYGSNSKGYIILIYIISPEIEQHPL